MKSNFIVRTIGVGAFLALGLIGCTQPSTTEVTTPDNPAPQTAPQANAPNTEPGTIAPGKTMPETVAPGTANTQTVSLDDAAERIDDAFDQDANLKGLDLDADDEQNSIVLTGRVQDATQRTLAENIARQTAPNASIINQIAVQ